MKRSESHQSITLFKGGENSILYPALALLFLIFFFPLPLLAADIPHHEIKVSIDPDGHRIAATDTITVPANAKREFHFLLHPGLNPASPDPKVRIVKDTAPRTELPLEAFTARIPEGVKDFTIHYEGTIYHPVERAGKNRARGFDQTLGTIEPAGVYLAGSSGWYPQIESDFVTFTLAVDLPKGWDAVSQGTRSGHEKTEKSTAVVWNSPEPQEEIYLVASKFIEYEKKSGDLTAMVFLRTPDEGLATRYLDATLRYIAMYDGLIGRYPYAKFALVENFWETGFGMPSFTLLGPTVLRLPFIINTSYPHEILHNWWGNSVYPVFEKGNWSEGITAYLADHLLKEQQGEGADYRLTTLQKYADYVSTGRDFPLTRFTSRHDPSTEAVGYGKSLMFFHMLRLELGDKEFTSAIRNFYRTYKFHLATFDGIENSFRESSRKNMKLAFDQWITRTGAPQLRLIEANPEKHGDGYVVKGVIEQVQVGEAYRLHIPVAVAMEGQGPAFQGVIEMDGKKADFSITVPSRPLRLDIDPEFDVFRRLDRDELPPAISQVLGTRKMLVVLPASAGRELLAAYRQFAELLRESGPDEVDIKLDNEIKSLPADRSVAILGWENSLLRNLLPAWKKYDLSFTPKSIRLGKNEIPKENHSFVLTARNPGSKDTALMFIAADMIQALPGLGRKLPHYHKYSCLAFEGEEPANVAKGRWPVVDSPLTVFFDESAKAGRIEMGKLAVRQPLASLQTVFSEARMIETIKYLSSSQLKGREIGTPEIDKAADYIAGKFREAGLAPGGDGASYFQTWNDQARGITMKNVIGVIPGKNADQSVVAGAHYDHLGLGTAIGRTEDKGRIHPGADDNGSGVAVLLELARVLRENPQPGKSIVFAAFTGEEEGKLGSRYYVSHEEKYPVSKCIGMVNFDTVGRLDKKKLLVLGADSAKEWVHILRGAGFVTGVDIDVVSEDLDSSDQKSFQEAGVPAVQLFSGPHPDYHRPGDTLDKIDPVGMIKIASVGKEVVEYLAERGEPLSSTLKPGAPSETGPKKERKTTFGTIPDFAFRGSGYRISGVTEGSPAAKAGLREGDVIVRVNSSPVTGLRDFSDILKSLKPGEKVDVTFLRDNKERTVRTEVKSR